MPSAPLMRVTVRLTCLSYRVNSEADLPGGLDSGYHLLDADEEFCIINKQEVDGYGLEVTVEPKEMLFAGILTENSPVSEPNTGGGLTVLVFGKHALSEELSEGSVTEVTGVLQKISGWGSFRYGIYVEDLDIPVIPAVPPPYQAFGIVKGDFVDVRFFCDIEPVTRHCMVVRIDENHAIEVMLNPREMAFAYGGLGRRIEIRGPCRFYPSHRSSFAVMECGAIRWN